MSTPLVGAGKAAADLSDRRSLLKQIATFVRERTNDDCRTLSLLMQYEPVRQGSHTVIGPLILPHVPGLKQHELVTAFADLLGPLDAALVADAVAPDSFISRMRCNGILRLPSAVSQTHHIGNPLLLQLWQRSMNTILSAAWHMPAGAARRIEKAFSTPLRFAEADWSIVLLWMRRLAIQWRRVKGAGSFSIGETQFVVSPRDYGLLVTLFLADSLGTRGCSLDRRLLFHGAK